MIITASEARLNVAAHEARLKNSMENHDSEIEAVFFKMVKSNSLQGYKNVYVHNIISELHHVLPESTNWPFPQYIHKFKPLAEKYGFIYISFDSPDPRGNGYDRISWE